MKEISLTKGLVAIIDDEDFERVSRYKWVSLKNKRTVYASRSSDLKGGKKTMYMHRFIMNPPSDMQVDHINGDGLDNRRVNLRVCTQSQNLKNSWRHREQSNYQSHQ